MFPICNFNYLNSNFMNYDIYSLYLNELLRASCPSPFGPAGLFKFVPDKLVRKNLASNLARSPLIREPLDFVPFMQHVG